MPAWSVTAAEHDAAQYPLIINLELAVDLWSEPSPALRPLVRRQNKAIRLGFCGTPLDPDTE